MVRRAAVYKLKTTQIRAKILDVQEKFCIQYLTERLGDGSIPCFEILPRSYTEW